MENHHYILIMAGGSGTRLYPVSRENKPKHLSRIIGNSTLLQQTYNRAVKLVPKDNIFISTNAKYFAQVLDQVPSLTKDQIIAEPEKRNTAPAMALGVTLISLKDPEAIVAAISCDHQILKVDAFIAAFKLGFNAVAKNLNAILAIGIQPTSPETGYGYIEKNHIRKDGKGKESIYEVRRFVEKPDRKTAQTYLESGNFYWNASYFIFSSQYFLEEVKRFLPEVHEGLEKIRDQYGKKDFKDVLNKEFLKFPEAQVDKSIMEKTAKMLVLPVDLGWCDVGSWDVVTDLIEEKKKDEDGNFSEGLFSNFDSHNTIVLGNGNGSKRLIAAIGLDNVTIVNTNDVILVMARGRGQEVKNIVEDLKKRKLDKML